nr:hypothetical protein [Tanacetum cinerariifolium]
MEGRGQSKATRGSTRRFGKSQVLTPKSPLPLTPPCTLSVPQPLSPAPNSLSPPPFKSQTLAVTSTTTTSATTAATLTATVDIDSCRVAVNVAAVVAEVVAAEVVVVEVTASVWLLKGGGDK